MNRLQQVAVLDGKADFTGWSMVKEVSTDTIHWQVWTNSTDWHLVLFGTIGTLLQKDWAQNLETDKVLQTFYGALGLDKIGFLRPLRLKVLQGFVKEYQDIKKVVLGILPISGPLGTLYISGHSQGAAHATLFTLLFASIFPKVKVITTTIGSPRLFSWKSARKVNRVFNKLGLDVVRFRGAIDPVPNLPWWIFNWAHVGRKVVVPKCFHLTENYVKEIRDHKLGNV